MGRGLMTWNHLSIKICWDLVSTLLPPEVLASTYGTNTGLLYYECFCPFHYYKLQIPVTISVTTTHIPPYSKLSILLGRVTANR